jgi:hypothetical protein
MLNDWQSFKPGDAVSMRNQRTASSLMGLQAAGTDFFENLGAANIKGKAKILYAIGLFQRGQRGRDGCQGRSWSHADGSVPHFLKAPEVFNHTKGHTINYSEIN